MHEDPITGGKGRSSPEHITPRAEGQTLEPPFDSTVRKSKGLLCCRFSDPLVMSPLLTPQICARCATTLARTWCSVPDVGSAFGRGTKTCLHGAWNGNQFSKETLYFIVRIVFAP